MQSADEAPRQFIVGVVTAGHQRERVHHEVVLPEFRHQRADTVDVRIGIDADAVSRGIMRLEFKGQPDGDEPARRDGKGAVRDREIRGVGAVRVLGAPLDRQVRDNAEHQILIVRRHFIRAVDLFPVDRDALGEPHRQVPIIQTVAPAVQRHAGVLIFQRNRVSRRIGLIADFYGVTVGERQRHAPAGGQGDFTREYLPDVLFHPVHRDREDRVLHRVRAAEQADLLVVIAHDPQRKSAPVHVDRAFAEILLIRSVLRDDLDAIAAAHGIGETTPAVHDRVRQFRKRHRLAVHLQFRERRQHGLGDAVHRRDFAIAPNGELDQRVDSGSHGIGIVGQLDPVRIDGITLFRLKNDRFPDDEFRRRQPVEPDLLAAFRHRGHRFFIECREIHGEVVGRAVFPGGVFLVTELDAHPEGAGKRHGKLAVRQRRQPGGTGAARVPFEVGAPTVPREQNLAARFKHSNGFDRGRARDLDRSDREDDCLRLGRMIRPCVGLRILDMEAVGVLTRLRLLGRRGAAVRFQHLHEILVVTVKGQCDRRAVPVIYIPVGGGRHRQNGAIADLHLDVMHDPVVDGVRRDKVQPVVAPPGRKRLSLLETEGAARAVEPRVQVDVRERGHGVVIHLHGGEGHRVVPGSRPRDRDRHRDAGRPVVVVLEPGRAPERRIGRPVTGDGGVVRLPAPVGAVLESKGSEGQARRIGAGKGGRRAGKRLGPLFDPPDERNGLHGLVAPTVFRGVVEVHPNGISTRVLLRAVVGQHVELHRGFVEPVECEDRIGIGVVRIGTADRRLPEPPPAGHIRRHGDRGIVTRIGGRVDHPIVVAPERERLPLRPRVPCGERDVGKRWCLVLVERVRERRCGHLGLRLPDRERFFDLTRREVRALGEREGHFVFPDVDRCRLEEPVDAVLVLFVPGDDGRALPDDFHV